MAKKLDSFEFSRLGSGRGSKYDEFLDGNIWQLTVDDAVGTEDIVNLRGSLYSRATRNGLKFQSQIIRTFDDEGDIEDEILVMRAYKPEDEE